MIEAPVTVSLGVVLSLPAKLERLLSPEADQWRLRKGEKNKIRLLKDRLQELDKYLVEPSNVETPASTARCWVKEVRELSYDINDFLDELAHGLNSAAAQKNLRGRVAKLREGLSRSRWVAQETARFRARLEEAIQRHKRYNLDKHHQSRATRIDSDEPPIPPLYGVEAMRLVGIDSSMAKLGDWLTGDGEQQLRVMSIVGPGGVGKTAIANELYCKLGRRFECRAFARSSQKPDMRRLLTSILLQIRRQRLPDDAELGNLIGTIREHLQDKHYFIIIDDLWASSMWDVVSRALPDGKCCSRVLFTTESDVVAQICSGQNSKYIFKMEPLSDNESKKIFFSRFPGNQSKENEQLYEHSSEIIRKCGGFPLATITIASLLARQQSWIEQYNWIRRSLSSNLRTDPTAEWMRQVLSLCYNNLPGRLKACMLYLSIYKEDHVIWKYDLVKQWLAEGFICAQEGKVKEEVASTYFDELVNGGMIQPVDINYNEDAAQPTRLRLLQVQSLAFFGLFKSLPSIAQFRLLRVMILHLWADQDNKSFDLTTVCQLFRLKYLEIVCNITLDLQTKMQGLQCLETLIIDSRISEVPLDIVHLPGLRYLSLPGDTNLPNGFGQLTSLQSLGCFNLSSNPADNVLNLGKLTNLQDLRLICSTMPSDNLEKKLQCLGSILSKLSNLKSLTMLPAGSSIATMRASASSINIYCDSLSSVSSPPALLQKLEFLLQICIFSILPKWIGKLRLLAILKIQVMGLSSNDVDILEGLPALSALMLYVQTASTRRILFDKKGFPVLKHFKFICSALCIAFVKGAMPNVRRLKLGFNANTLLQHSPVDAGFEHLTGLKEISAKIGNAGANESSRMAAQSALEVAFSPHRVSIKFVDWTFYGEKERSTAAQKEKHQTIENSNLIPDLITKEGSDERYGIGEKGSKQKTNKQFDNRIAVFHEQQEIQEMGSVEATQHHTGITVSLESSDEQQEVQEMGSVEATGKQCGITVLLESSVEHQEIKEMGPVEATSKKHGTGITVSLESSDEQQEIQEMGSVEAISKQRDTGSAITPGTMKPSPGAPHFCPPPVQSPVRGTNWNWFRMKVWTKPDREIWNMRSSVSCLGGGSKLRQDKNGQDAAATSSHSGRVLSRAGNNVQMFSLNELRTATLNFHMMNCIGRGGSGEVYKGNLKDGTQIAIKKLSAESKQGIREFLTEINVMSNVRHPNLVKVLGCCVEGKNRLLVYEYVENNSLANALLGPKNKCIPLDWQKRAAICIGTASGLAFLHEEAKPHIVHRDIKASNILLDKNLLPKIGDFGLAKLFPATSTHIRTHVAGTISYLAPEYAIRGQVTRKADIYSFGVLLLEVISGQSSSKSIWGPDMHVLLEWTWKLWEDGRLLEIVDPDLEEYPEEQMLRFIKLALLCTQAMPRQRPSMKQVVNMLCTQTEIDLENIAPRRVLKQPR
ncbi:hypothetical protein PAHAL_3G315800 [Panicum hallii]|uniref:Protein kinase domain-containing protein n=1 Tax=Panicum hallii TaxID=206008 RepID=A0A2S3HCZ1_9POAL|nr:hypothetical protein PAHAL_3G315800 [Panicum hallii]